MSLDYSNLICPQLNIWFHPNSLFFNLYQFNWWIPHLSTCFSLPAIPHTQSTKKSLRVYTKSNNSSLCPLLYPLSESSSSLVLMVSLPLFSNLNRLFSTKIYFWNLSHFMSFSCLKYERVPCFTQDRTYYFKKANRVLNDLWCPDFLS